MEVDEFIPLIARTLKDVWVEDFGADGTDADGVRVFEGVLSFLDALCEVSGALFGVRRDGE